MTMITFVIQALFPWPRRNPTPQEHRKYEILYLRMVKSTNFCPRNFIMPHPTPRVKKFPPGKNVWI